MKNQLFVIASGLTLAASALMGQGGDLPGRTAPAYEQHAAKLSFTGTEPGETRDKEGQSA